LPAATNLVAAIVNERNEEARRRRLSPLISAVNLFSQQARRQQQKLTSDEFLGAEAEQFFIYQLINTTLLVANYSFYPFY